MGSRRKWASWVMMPISWISYAGNKQRLVESPRHASMIHCMRCNDKPQDSSGCSAASLFPALYSPDAHPGQGDRHICVATRRCNRRSASWTAAKLHSCCRRDGIRTQCSCMGESYPFLLRTSCTVLAAMPSAVFFSNVLSGDCS